MSKMFTDAGVEVTKLVESGKTKFVETIREAKELTKMIGYYYPIFDAKKNVIGYGIPK